MALLKFRTFFSKKSNLILLLISTFFISCNTKCDESYSILEIKDTEYRLTSQILLSYCSKININKSDVYQWEQYWVVFTPTNKIELLKSELEAKYSSLDLKIYKKPFYNFNQQEICGKNSSQEWEHNIFTANLVQDTILQNEYMEYHRTQFEEWPEVSKGFCNAHFQQLLVFRNGKQLMLVISIPKGKTLEELNPKTTENNPRVDEWNKIMANYQEGIEDAPKGSTWVQFKPISNE